MLSSSLFFLLLAFRFPLLMCEVAELAISAVDTTALRKEAATFAGTCSMKRGADGG
jgi:hypothetical protein